MEDKLKNALHCAAKDGEGRKRKRKGKGKAPGRPIVMPDGKPGPDWKKVFTGFAIILVMLYAMMSVVSIGSTARAYGAESASLSIGSKNGYGGYQTTWMWADGEVAYCANPSAATPSGGTYSKHELDAPSGRTAETAADLWFSYGSPGFDASMWPSKWYDGTDMTNARYAALAHILLSDTYTSDGSYALFGCDSDFRAWCRYYVFGFDSNDNLCNENATGRLIAARMDEVPQNFYPFELHTGEDTQLILSFVYIPNGNIDLQKVSTNPELTDGNKLYSLKGAVYTVYSDADCKTKVAEIVTDDDGYGRADDLAVGDYWVKETKRSAGMALDETVYPVAVRSEETTRVNTVSVPEDPQTGIVAVVLSKCDKDTGEPEPQGDAAIEGARFKVSYYDGHYSTVLAAKASGSPLRSWIIETDASGNAYLDAEHLVSGDAFYNQKDGRTVCLPLGCVVIQEVSAPQGYLCDAPAKVVNITSDSATDGTVHTYNAPVMPDTVKRGDYRLFKEVPTTSDEEDQDLTRIAIEGVQFQIINESDSPVLSPDTQELVARGEVVTTLVTDENGFATTKDHVPDGWTAALAYGEYRIHECIPPEVAERVKEQSGITLIPVDDWRVTITEEQQHDPVQVVANHIPQTPLAIQKVDADTGLPIPLECSFQIYDAEGNLVTYADHMNECVIDTWTTVKNGHVTLPMKLDEGTYTVREIVAPEGYVINEEPVEFTVDEYRTWDEPITVTVSDNAIRGKIVIRKTEAGTDSAVMGAEYCVKAAEDIATGDGTVRFKAGEIVGYVTTDENGEAEVDGLYLGAYTVYETKSPEGWALDCAERTVCIESEGQTVPVVTVAHEVEDSPTELRILKTDSSEEAKPLADALFRIWAVDADGSAVEDGFEVEFATDADGLFCLDHLPHGLYMIEETEAPDGYFIAEEAEPVMFTVNDQGLIGLAEPDAPFGHVLELSFVNEPTKVDFSKVELTTQAELPGATMQLLDAEGNIVDEWVSDKEPHRIEGLAVNGEYELRETAAPDGYLLAESIKFTVADTGEVQSVVMCDELAPEPEQPEPEQPEETPKGGLAQTGDTAPVVALALLALAAAGSAVLAKALSRKKGKKAKLAAEASPDSTSDNLA